MSTFTFKTYSKELHQHYECKGPCFIIVILTIPVLKLLNLYLNALLLKRCYPRILLKFFGSVKREEVL